MSILDNLAKCTPITRMNWMKKPKIESYKFKYSPYYSMSGRLMWRYEESDAGLRERIKNIKLIMK